MASPPTLHDIEAMADQAFAEIPDALARHATAVAIQVCDFPDEETCRVMELDSPYDLLGLYHGVSLDQKSVDDLPQDLDHVYLYRRPILDYWAEQGGELEDIVRQILLHEIGHHFGFSDAEMDHICAQARREAATGSAGRNRREPGAAARSGR